MRLGAREWGGLNSFSLSASGCHVRVAAWNGGTRMYVVYPRYYERSFEPMSFTALTDAIAYGLDRGKPFDIVHANNGAIAWTWEQRCTCACGCEACEQGYCGGRDH